MDFYVLLMRFIWIVDFSRFRLSAFRCWLLSSLRFLRSLTMVLSEKSFRVTVSFSSSSELVRVLVLDSTLFVGPCF